MEALILVTFATAVAEMVLSGRWVGFYFRKGIPLFKKSLRYVEAKTISPEDLSEHFAGGPAEAIVFREIGKDEIAFRERLFSLRLLQYTPVMHGIIRLDRTHREISMTGYANWFIIVFSATWVSLDSMFSGSNVSRPQMTLFLLVLLGALYAIQFYRFTKVFRLLGEKFASHPL